MCAGTAATAAADASTCAETPKGWGSPGQVRVRLLLLMPCVCVCTCVHVCAHVCVCVCVFVPLLKLPLLLCAACPLTVQAPLRTTLPCLPQTRLSSRTPFPTRLQPSWTRLATRLVDLSRPLSLPAALLTHTHTHIHTHTHSLSLTHSHKHTLSVTVFAPSPLLLRKPLLLLLAAFVGHRCRPRRCTARCHLTSWARTCSSRARAPLASWLLLCAAMSVQGTLLSPTSSTQGT